MRDHSNRTGGNELGSKELTRGAGVLLAITSLPSSYGIGTLGEAAFQFVDLLVDLKQRYWQVLPIGPTSFGNSPYQSYSAFAGNPYLIDLDDLVKDGLLQETEIRSFNWGTDDADIDYATIYENRYKILRMAFSRFSAKSEDFLAFTEKSDRWLSDYSLYTALKRHFGDIEWQSWDVPLRDRDPEAVKEYQEILHNDIMFCKFCQYEFFKQWMQLKQYANSRGVQIIGDMPLYVASAWMYGRTVRCFYWDRMEDRMWSQGQHPMHFPRAVRYGAVRYMTGTSWKRMALHGGRQECLRTWNYLM